MACARASFWLVSCSVLPSAFAAGSPRDANHLIQASKRLDAMADYAVFTGTCHLGDGGSLVGYHYVVDTESECRAFCDGEGSLCTGYTQIDGGPGTKMCAFFNVAIAQTSEGTVGALCYVKVAAPAPTPAPTPGPAVQVSGDPHCRNVKGESFDITTTGEMTMLEVPGPSSAPRPDFRVKVVIGHISDHDACSPTVIKEVKIGGGWLARGDDEMRVTPGRLGIPVVPDSWMEIFRGQSPPPGLSVDILGRPTSSAARVEYVKITVFQTVILLFQRRGTRSGVDYFDMRVRNIAALGRDIGGLLGNDPHDVQAAPSLQCSNANSATRLSAVSTEPGGTNQGMMSVAWVE